MRSVLNRRNALCAFLFAAGGVPGLALLPLLPSQRSGPRDLLPFACPPGSQPPCLPGDILLEDSKWLGLPCSGPAWDKVKQWSTKGKVLDWNAPAGVGSPLQIHDQSHDMEILAAALRWRRSQAGGCPENDCDPGPGVLDCRTKVEQALVAFTLSAIDYSDDDDAPAGEDGGQALPLEEPWAIARNVAGYVIAADIIDYDDPAFRAKLAEIRDTPFKFRGKRETLEQFAKRRPNNQGLACNLARLAIALYMDDGRQDPREVTELVDCKNVFLKFLGDPSVTTFDFDFGCTAWQADPSNPRGINPSPATVNGQDVGGALPDDQRRVHDLGACAGLPCSSLNVDVTYRTNYTWESMQCLVMTALLLDRCRYPSFTWQDHALDRAVTWLYDVNGFPPEETIDGLPGEPCVGGSTSSDDTWVPWITDKRYSTGRATTAAGEPGKVFGFASWWAPGI